MLDDSLFEDFNIVRDSLYTRKIKMYKKRINPFEYYDDHDFKDLYRFDKSEAMNIVNLIREDLIENNSTHGSPISPEIMVMATIRYIAKGSYQKDISDAHGISQQSMTGIIRKVVTALARRMESYIYYPLDREGIKKLKIDFYNIASFPQCVGAIDCTHIKIKNPGGELGGRHRCRKGFYSINVQIICDSNCRILDIVARWRGSAHDSRIWRESTIKQRLENTDLRGGVLLGDRGYPCSNILLTPYRNADDLLPAQQRYNRAHILTRNTVEKLFGQLKNKFRSCLNGISVDLTTAKSMIVAIAVLFNISKKHETQFLTGNENITGSEDEENQQLPESSRGNIIREQFIDKYFA